MSLGRQTRPISLEALMADKILAVLAHQSPGGRPVSHSSANSWPPPWGHSLSMGGGITPSQLWAQSPNVRLAKALPESPTQVLP